MRVAGSGHSFTDIACTDGLMLDLSGMRRVLRADGELVTVEAGITLHELGAELAQRGLAMENQGDIDRQTLAGALATATHGTGARFRNLSAQVAGMRLVTGAGEPVELREGDEDLRAARVGLGSLGAVSQVTLRCVPLFTLRRVDEPRPLGETLERFDELAGGHDHFEFYAFPYADTAIVRLSERGDFEPRPPSSRKLYLQEAVLENGVVGTGARVGRRFNRLIPSVNRGISRLVTKQVRTDHGYRVYASRRNVRFTEMEYAVPREHGPEAARRVLELVERRRLPVGFPIEVRVVRCRRRDALDRPRSRHRLRGGAPVPRHGVRGLLPCGRADHGGLRRPPALGQAPLPDGRNAARALSGLGRLPGRQGPARPGGRFANEYSERVLGSGRSAARSVIARAPHRPLSGRPGAVAGRG